MASRQRSQPGGSGATLPAEFGSPPARSPPKKSFRSRKSNAFSDENVVSIAPLPRECAGIPPTAVAGLDSCTPRRSVVAADVERLTSLFTPLSVSKVIRSRSCGPASPRTSVDVATVASAAAPVDPLLLCPIWIMITLEQYGVVDQWTASIASGYRWCSKLGICEALCYLKAKFPQCDWCEQLMISSLSNKHGAVCPLPSLSLGDGGSSSVVLSFDGSRQPCSIRLTGVPSRRVLRQFGWQRFMILHCTSPCQREVFKRAVVSGFVFRQRRYRFLYGQPGDWSAWFLCEHGEPDYSHVTVEDVWGWHIDLSVRANANIPLCKRWSRMNLMFSKTVPTAMVSMHSEVADDASIGLRFTSDVWGDRACSGGCLTDGNAAISAPAARIVCSLYGQRRGGCDGYGISSDTFPVAMQGRLGEYKGVWVVHPDTTPWISVRPSMKKFSIDDSTRTETQATFEVLRVSSPTGPACLNRQILILLSCLGVSTSAVLAIASEAISVLSSCCTDADSARIAVQYLRVGKLETLLRQLIACGVWDEPFVLQQLKGTAESMLSAIGAQAHIPVLRSRRVMIISDPTGLLKDGEVYYRSSLPLDCDGSDGHTVIGRVVLARNPCHALSDIQTATAVDLGPRFQTMSAEGEWWPRHLIDVLVFPATGRVSLASLLSGGDYDGDIVWMCWDDRLLPASKVTASTPHRSVPDVLTAPLTDYWSHSDGAEAYLSSFDDCTLHLATNLHLAWVDKLLSRLSSKPSASRLECGSHPAVCHLAKLCADMVDAPKTGSIGSIPIELRQVPYPHYLKGTTRCSNGYVKSSSLLGLLYDQAQMAEMDCPSTVSSEVLLKSRLQPHPVIIMLAEKLGWSRFRGVAITGLKQYNSGIADKRAAMQQHLTSTDTIAAHCRQSLASKVTADELPALAMACYVVSVTASAANGRLVPYRFCWDVFGDVIVSTLQSSA